MWFSDVDFKTVSRHKHHLYSLFTTLLRATIKDQDEDSEERKARLMFSIANTQCNYVEAKRSIAQDIRRYNQPASMASTQTPEQSLDYTGFYIIYISGTSYTSLT